MGRRRKEKAERFHAECNDCRQVWDATTCSAAEIERARMNEHLRQTGHELKMVLDIFPAKPQQ